MLIADFVIDDGELDGISADKAFILGVEFGMAHARLQTGLPFEMYIHTENLLRVDELILSQNRLHSISGGRSTPKGFHRIIVKGS